MRWLRLLIAVFAIITLVGPVAGAIEVDNPWLQKPFLNIAHQGGAHEAPSNTLFAFKEAERLGYDVLELDVHATADRHLVVIHDTTVDRTTNGSGRIDSMTLAQVKTLDAAYWFSGGADVCKDNGCTWPYRGMATGDVTPVAGYTANDFKIPTLEEVLIEFPDMLINIEIKRTAPDTVPYEKELSDLLNAYERANDTIVVSFYDNATELFKVHNSSVSTATGTGETAAFWASAQGPLPGAPNLRYHALQVPITFEGVTVVTQEFVERAHANGLAVHVWTINAHDEMCELIAWDVDGIMTDRPSVLESILNGTQPCIASG